MGWLAILGLAAGNPGGTLKRRMVGAMLKGDRYFGNLKKMQKIVGGNPTKIAIFMNVLYGLSQKT